MAIPLKRPRESNQKNPVLDAIYSRRSVRAFDPEFQVTEDEVRALLDASVHAPSAMNRQPWAFVVIRQPELLRRISDSAKKTILQNPEWRRYQEKDQIPLEDPGFDIFYGAKTVIVICMKDEPGFSPLGDCYLAAQNLMLAAHALGLASCPVGFARDVLKEAGFRVELSIPHEYLPVLPIALGHPKTKMPPTARARAEILSWME